MSDPQLAVFEAAIANRWVIEGDVGRGPRGTVYRARDASSGEPVAIKVFRSDLASAVDSARFVAQMRTTADIRHDNLLPILEISEAAGRLFVVMPFIDGESLRARLRREGRLELTGAPPFTGDTPLAVLRKTVFDAPVPVTTIRDGLPPDVDVALDRMLAKTAADRYPDAAHVVDALSALTLPA